MKNKTLLLLCTTLLLTAIVEPAYASDTDFLFQEPASMLCLLNNKLCKDGTNHQNTDEKSRNVEGGIFSVIDDALNNHVADVNVRMFRYMVEKKSDNAEFVVKEAKRLNDEVLSVQATREALGKKLNAGTITPENYAFALKKLEMEDKYNKKQANEMAKILRNDLKDVKLSNEFDKVTKTKEDQGNKGKRNNEKETETVSGNKGKEAVENGKSNPGEADSSEGKSKGENGDKSKGNKGSTGNSDKGNSGGNSGSSGDKSGASSGGGSSGGGSSSGGSNGGGGSSGGSSSGGSSGSSGGGSGGGSSGGGGGGGGSSDGGGHGGGGGGKGKD